MDKFDALQIKGLYEKYTAIMSSDPGQTEFTMTAMSNGVRSRPVKYRLGNKSAPILNLVVELEMGVVQSLNWKNSCYDDQGCAPQDCEETNITFEETPYVEEVRNKSCINLSIFLFRTVLWNVKRTIAPVSLS